MDPMGAPPSRTDHRTFETEPDTAVEQWEPSGVVTAMWLSLSIMLGALAFFLFGLIFALFGSQPAGETIVFDWLVVGALTALTLVLHQLLHAGVARMFGRSPAFQLDVLQWTIPVMYCRVTGQYFSRSQYLVFALAPLIVLSILGVAIMPVSAYSALLIIPLAVNASLSTRDVWMAWVVWRLEPESIVQVTNDGLLLVRPLKRTESGSSSDGQI